MSDRIRIRGKIGPMAWLALRIVVSVSNRLELDVNLIHVDL